MVSKMSDKNGERFVATAVFLLCGSTGLPKKASPHNACVESTLFAAIPKSFDHLARSAHLWPW